MGRAVIRRYLAVIDAMIHGQTACAAEARELCDELCDPDTNIDARLTIIETQPSTAFEKTLRMVVHLKR